VFERKKERALLITGKIKIKDQKWKAGKWRTKLSKK